MARHSYPIDLTDAQWALISPHLPTPRPGERPRQTDLRAVVDAIVYLLRAGCQWRMLPRDLPHWVLSGGISAAGVWTRMYRASHRVARRKAGSRIDPTVVIKDARSVKTTERGVVAASTATSA
ncbi:transposase [Palleronia aestuarii]|uniref:transposase n=1 Tax=Palleronia aestuarii TaxID=568105 RepID=UPI0014730525|nr:transposase [Palleronia aestuarii]